MLAERFANMSHTRDEVVKRISDSIWEKEELLKSDLEKESDAREESMAVIREYISQDFPSL